MNHDFETKDDDRPIGRPRSARADAAILKAATELLAEVGFHEMSIEAIAARAGVGKTTIYRRYASKDDVVIAAIASVHADVEIPDTGNTRQDMIQLAETYRDQTIRSFAFPVVRHLFGLAASHPEIMETFRNQIARPRQAALRQIIQRGIERGEIRDDFDSELAVDVLPGLMIFRFMLKDESSDPPSQQMIVDFIDVIWNGIARRDEL